MTSLRWNRPICTPGLLIRAKIVVGFETIGILMESNIPPFFEHNMSFFYILFRSLCIQINRFQSEGQA